MRFQALLATTGLFFWKGSNRARQFFIFAASKNRFMKKFLTVYLANDGAGVFALLWILGMIGFVFYIFTTGLPS